MLHDRDNATGVAALLKPRSIAIVGASPRVDSLGGRPIVNLGLQGYTGKIFPINPRYQMIGDRPCFSDLRALPETPDVVLVLVAADHIFPTLDQAVQIGARSAIVFAAGFAETSQAGAHRQDLLKDYAARGLRICGPNCNGVFNVVDRVAMGFSPAFEFPARRGRVALLSQSGAIATGISSRGMELGVGFSHIVATGNEADLELSDFIEYLLDDPEVAVFTLFIEGLKNPARFLRLAEKALDKGKPIVALKVGRSESGTRVALSHTGSMTGSYQVLAGALRQRGVVFADGLDELCGLAAIFAVGRKPRGKGIAVASISGGMAALLADQCEAAVVPLAEFGSETRENLAAVLPAAANAANPLDVTGQVVNRPELWAECLRIIGADPEVEIVVSIQSIIANQLDHRLANDVIDAAAHVMQIGVWASAAPAGCGMDALRDAGLPVFLRSEDAVRAIASWRHYWTSRGARLGALRDAVDFPHTRASPAPSAWAMLSSAGIPIARQVLVSDETALDLALQQLRYPLALKVQSEAIAHKTELDLLRLGIMSPEDARRAYRDLLAALAAHRPDAAVDGILMQEMITGRRELILGARHEPGVGHAIVLGLGGIFSEVLGDISTRLAPLADFDVEEMVGELRGRRLFTAVRGLAPIQQDMLADIVIRFSKMVLQHEAIVGEFEINPLIASDDGSVCTAVDVLLNRRPAHSEA